MRIIMQLSCPIKHCKYQMMKERENKKMKNALWALIASQEVNLAWYVRVKQQKWSSVKNNL